MRTLIHLICLCAILACSAAVAQDQALSYLLLRNAGPTARQGGKALANRREYFGIASDWLKILQHGFWRLYYQTVIRVRWIQAAPVKPGAAGWLTAAHPPLLVTARFGRGRVAVFAGTVYVDSPPQREGVLPLFCAAPGYAGFPKKLLQWLQGKG